MGILGALVQANCVVEIGSSAVTPARKSPPALTARIRWSGNIQPAAQAVQRAWEHVLAHAGGSSAGGHGSSVADAHFQEALLASSPLFVSISAPDILADISRVRIACSHKPQHNSSPCAQQICSCQRHSCSDRVHLSCQQVPLSAMPVIAQGHVSTEHVASGHA